VSPAYSSLNLIPLGPPGSGEGKQAAIFAGESVAQAIEAPVSV